MGHGSNPDGDMRPLRRHGGPLLACLLLVAALALPLAACFDGAPKNGKLAIAAGEDLVIKTADIGAHASFYPVEVDGMAMEVLAVRAADGSIRTAFNTCEVCYDSGRGYYVQEGDELVCQNCGNRFKTSQVEIQSNGCNPWPIFAADKTVTADSITISYDFLAESTRVFANWRRS
jgi:hypothetical protein